MPILKVENLNQSFGKKHILKNVSFDLSKKEVVVFLGPNGAGKTTLLRTTIGLLQSPKQDEANKKNLIRFENKVINKLPVCKRVEEGLLYLPQQTSLFRQISVIDNLKIVFNYHKYWNTHEGTKEARYKKFENEMLLWLEQIGLSNHKNQLAGSLSGGQKRKLEVVRSVLMHPKAIMFDEPFAGVDPKSIYELKKIFSDMASKDGIAVLVSDHNVDQLLSIATRVYVVINGKVVTSGGIKDIINNKDTKDMYLGNQFYTEISRRFL